MRSKACMEFSLANYVRGPEGDFYKRKTREIVGLVLNVKP